MFKKARIKLTLWYLLIIMFISIFFSIVIYLGVDREVTRIERRTKHEISVGVIRDRLILNLIILNFGILGVSGFLGFLLAGITLKPIEELTLKEKEFISNASHELRTPLTSLKTQIEVGLRDKNINLTKTKSLLKSNLEEVDKMQNLTNYLLALARLQKLQLNLINHDLQQISQKAIEKIKIIAKSKNIKIIEKLQKVKIKGDLDSLTELAVILLDNAIKYSNENSQVIIKTYKESADAVLEIQDFGIGINQKDLPHIFESFYRSQDLKSQTEGFGLGLSIAKNIADLHNAKIKVESEIGKGSIFQLRLRIQI